jgi:hypothetical protein
MQTTSSQTAYSAERCEERTLGMQATRAYAWRTAEELWHTVRAKAIIVTNRGLSKGHCEQHCHRARAVADPAARKVMKQLLWIFVTGIGRLSMTVVVMLVVTL